MLTAMFSRYIYQSVLFSENLSRLDLLEINLPEPLSKPIAVNVWRNHAFESVIPLIDPFCRFGGWRSDFWTSAYDDSLLFEGHRLADIELLWLDSSRFPLESNFADWSRWLEDRLQVLRRMSHAAIVLATWTPDEEKNKRLHRTVACIPDAYYVDLKETCKAHEIELLDTRTAKLAGTPISKAAQLILARQLACHWMPASILPPVKAVALDLDETLYKGVLGEDGIQGVQCTSGHLALQQQLKGLKEQGIFLALVSRNERLDVETLFETRQDFPLRWNDFSVVEVSWGDKAVAIERIASQLRIAPDAILFIDDNLGELENVAQKLHPAHTIYAAPNASLTARTLSFYPGLWRWKVEKDSGKRILDLRANQERESLAMQSADEAEYFRSLGITLTFQQSPKEQMTRLVELSGKTNQFNLALRRVRQTEMAEYMDRSDAAVMSVALSDRLSDSGIIAVIIAVLRDGKLVVEELCISCRALGRRLEDTIVLLALKAMPIFDSCRGVAFEVQHGPRNQPALAWLAQFIKGDQLPEPGLVSTPLEKIREFRPHHGITLNYGAEICR